MKNIYGINPISEILKITNDGVLFLIEGALNARQKELETIALSKEINIQYLNNKFKIYSDFLIIALNIFINSSDSFIKSSLSLSKN